jgi:alkanesulfonate monooxygenase SsuD/methylene tetrahydromethanopterin reductase-like flavin-dependent oxidoreductase (luciferase family)
LRPTPPSQPLPLWVGGNGKRAIARAARFGECWAPVVKDAVGASTISSVAGGSAADLKKKIATLLDLRAREAGGRPIDICLLRGSGGWATADPSPEVDEEIAALDEVGVTWVAFHPVGTEVAEVVERIGRWAEAYGDPAPAG